MQSKQTNRHQRVTEIRDIALARVMTQGSWVRLASSRAPGGEISWFRYEGGGFTVSLRTPFAKRHAPPEMLKLFAALKSQGVQTPQPTLPWQLEIWPGEGQETEAKVLNVEWDDDGALLVTSFRRGSWEEDILQWRVAEEPQANVCSPNVRASGRSDLRLVTSQAL